MVECTAEFDSIAAGYEAQHAASIRLSGENTDFFSRQKIELLRRYASQHVPFVGDIMDFGAGIGNAVPHVHEIFPESQITALDVSANSLALCDARNLERVRTLHYDGTHIPSENGRFDIGNSSSSTAWWDICIVRTQSLEPRHALRGRQLSV